MYNGEEKVDGAKFTVNYELRNDPVTRSGNNQYVYYHDNEDGTYTFKRLKTYTGGNLFIKFVSDDVKDLSVEISMKMVIPYLILVKGCIEIIIRHRVERLVKNHFLPHKR